MPVPLIGKEDHETDWYGAACGVGLLNPPENRTETVPMSFFLEISPFTPNTTPIKETEGSRIQSVHDFPKSPIRFRTTLSNPRNWIKWEYFIFFSVFFPLFSQSHPQPPASLSLGLSLSVWASLGLGLSQFGLCCTAPHPTSPPHSTGPPQQASNSQQPPTVKKKGTYKVTNI